MSRKKQVVEKIKIIGEQKLEARELDKTKNDEVCLIAELNVKEKQGTL